MKLELRDFQRTAVRELLSRLESARLGYRGGAGQRQAVGLTATTGAGKTVIAAAVIEAILFGSDEFGVDPDPNAVFLWMTDLPELNAQTQNKVLDASSELRFDLLTDIKTTFNDESLAPGRVYFLNTQKLGVKGDLTKRGPQVKRNFTFWDVVRKTIEEDRRTLYLVVDEAHRGMTESKKIEEANSIIQRFIKGYPEMGMPPAPIVLGISATPERFFKVVESSGRTTAHWPVPAADVRASGLIKAKTLAEYAGERQTDAMALFPEAVRTWKTATDQWAAYHETYSKGEDPLVIPALIVQVENEAGGKITQTDLDAIIRTISEVAGPLPDSAFVHAFGESQPEPVGGRVVRYLEPSRIAGDNDARVVFFKTSLGTGWDCPRAEVLFSFRRAVDPTSVAQTIGRMVRTPLARRIDENEDLNSAYVFLPYYSANAVKAIVAHLNESGNEAIAGTIENRRGTLSLALRSGRDEVVAAIEAVPSYLVPTPRRRQELRVLADLTGFLSKNGIDPAAYAREMRDCANVLVAKRALLAGDPDFKREVDDENEVVVHRIELLPGEREAIDAGTRTLVATEESIGRLFTVASRRLTNEVANAYVRQRLAQDPKSMGTARLEAYALAARDEVLEELNRRASERIDALRQAHGRDVEDLSSAQQSRYKNILRQAPDPSPIAIQLPSVALFARGEESLLEHIYADAGGNAAIDLNNWELDSIRSELARPGVLGWLRSVDREGWALCVPWRDGNTWRGFFPDFIVVRDDGDGPRAHIIDPHDHTKPDAVGKAKGLSAYADKHADQLGHIDLVAKIDGRYRRLHLEKAAIRKRVDALQTLNELRGLYVREG